MVGIGLTLGLKKMRQLWLQIVEENMKGLLGKPGQNGVLLRPKMGG